MQGHAFDISYRNPVLVQGNSNSTWNMVFESSATKKWVSFFVCLFVFKFELSKMTKSRLHS